MERSEVILNILEQELQQMSLRYNKIIADCKKSMKTCSNYLEELRRIYETRIVNRERFERLGGQEREVEVRYFRKKNVQVTAAQWFRNGDHPFDGPRHFEGRVVKYYTNYALDKQVCKNCGRIMYDHGWIDTLEGGHIVCPGDWIITGIKGERYPCKPDIFKDTYTEVSRNRSE